MTKKEEVFAVLERIGYRPKYDYENDILIVYQMKHIYFLVDDEDEDSFVTILYPQFVEFEEGQEMLYLAACNKMTRETKLAKLYVDQTFSHITASCEFYYTSKKALEKNIRESLGILRVVRTAFNKTVRELVDSE